MKLLTVIAAVGALAVAAPVPAAAPLLPLPPRTFAAAEVCVTVSNERGARPGVVVWHRRDGLVGYATWRDAGYEIVYDNNLYAIPRFVDRAVRGLRAHTGPAMRIGCRGRYAGAGLTG